MISCAYGLKLSLLFQKTQKTLYEQCSTGKASMFSSNMARETYGFESHCSCTGSNLSLLHTCIMQCIVNQFHEGVLTKEYCYVIFLFAVGAVYDYFVNSNAYRKLLLFFYKLIFIYVFVYRLIYVSLFTCNSKRWNTCSNSMAIICRNDV